MPSPLDAGRKALAQGRTAEATRCFERHLKSRPNDADAWQLLGIARFQAGDRTASQVAMEAAVRAAPRRADARKNLGIVLLETDVQAALEAFTQAAQLDPSDAESEMNRGFALLQLERPKEAVAALRTALALAPKLATAHFHLGNALRALGRLEDALGCFRHAVALDPKHTDAANNLGTTLLHLGRTEEAVKALEQLSNSHPRFAPALLNLASAYEAAGLRQQTVAALERLTEAQPKLFEPWLALGTARREQAQPERALQAFNRGLALRPADPRALTERANLLQDQGDPEVARESLSGDTDVERLRRVLILPVIPSDRAEIAEARRRLREDLAGTVEARVPDPATAGGAYPFHLAYHGEENLETMQAVADFWLRACPELAWQAPELAPAETGRPIRLGVVSAFWRDHTVGHLFGDLVAALNPERFEVHLFLVGGRTDAMTRSWGEKAHQARRLAPELAAARRQIADARLDVLLYPELGMDAFTYFLSFARLARLQAVTWGHPETPATRNLDAFLSAEGLEAEGAQDRYAERLVQLPRLGIGFRPSPEPDAARREDYGLPDGRLYGCPQSLFKIHPDFDDALEQIAGEDPSAHFVFLHGRYPQWTERLKARWERSAPNLARRAMFLPALTRSRYLALLPLCDLLLDPFHFGGGHTSFEAFCMRRPVLTLPGRQLRNRITYAAYRQLGIEAAVATDAGDYVRKARVMATSTAETGALGLEIASRLDRLFDASLAARDLEHCLTTLAFGEQNRR